MGRSIYNVAEIIKALKETHNVPGKKKFQKIIYLIENLGNVDLGFDYELHFYGPYSTMLDDVLTKLEGEGLIHYEYSGLSHLICIDNYEENDLEQSDLTEKEKSNIAAIISQYGSKLPTELELLTTTHYAFVHLEEKNIDSIVSGVIRIKGDKYKKTEIIDAIKQLGIIN